MFKIILIAGLLALCQAVDQRLQVSVYIESQCPDCINLLQDSIKPALLVEDIDKILNIRFIPYGNAHYVKHDDGTYGYTCQHGPVECYGNLVEVCALNILQGFYQQVGFLSCLENRRKSTSAQFDQDAKACSESTPGLNDSIQTCVNVNNKFQFQGQVGQQLQLEAALETEALSPAHSYVPWITVDKQHNVQHENDIIANLLEWTCRNYAGEVEITACKK